MLAEKSRKQQLSLLIQKCYNFGFGYLAIDNQNLNDDDIRMFIEEIGVSGNLYYLRIEGNSGITSQSVKNLIRCYQKIDILGLSLSQIQEQTICEINTLKELYDLRIYGSRDRELHLKCIGGLQWNALMQIKLDNVKLSPSACKQLTKTSMPSLKGLGLPENNISNHMLIHLCKSQWSKLERVSFDKNRITRQGLHILRKSSWILLSYISFNRNLGKQDHRKLLLTIDQKKRNLITLELLKPKRIWVFFDEFNTTDQLNYIKEIVNDRRFMGEKLPENIVFLAACNPYRKKQESVNRIRAGIKKTNQVKGVQLAFKVKPPSLSMIQLMWDYQQLGEKQNQSYIEKMLSEMNYKKRDLLIKTIVWTHQLFKQTVEVSSVSLRDVARFKELYNWFKEHSTVKIAKKDEVDRQIKASNDNDNDTDPAQRAAILAFTFCYTLRYSTNVERRDFLQKIDQKMDFQKHHMQEILENEQKEYLTRLKIKGERIAYNSALMENVFTSLVCLMNKIPILIIGNPGSSKSLSIKMLNSNLRGQNSSAQFCRNLPEINMIYYQGSEASTSKGVEQVFDKATSKNTNDGSKKWNILNCILFDEIGLAEKFIHNPLKVLHAKLQTNIKQIGFIGISNWELDAAKMSRFLVISRSNPDENEVKDTAVKIYQSYFEEDNNHIERFKVLGSHYFKFINRWNQNLNNREGFFGLRDFYSYIKYVCKQIEDNGNDPNEIDKTVAKAIQINFDGQKQSLKNFREIASTSEKYRGESMDPIQLVNKNLEDSESRCLMLIIRGDSLIPIINDKITINGVSRKAVCVYGSTFLEDQQSQEYNLEVTSLIINHVSRGNILAFKDINNTIQTSFYDLFNKSFSHIGNKKYCRIAVGANSNPKCNVHSNFNAIVYVDQEKLRELDLAFLNRFEKHYLNLKSMITNEEIQVLKDISRWIEDLLSSNQPETILKSQNFLINSSEESIVTLIIKYRAFEDFINRIKADLLKNRTTDFTIAIKDNQDHVEFVRNLMESVVPVNQCKEDMIVFTYDQFSNLTQESTIFNGKNYIIRISEIKNEKGLRKELTTALTSEQYDNIQIKLYYQNHFMHINFLLFLAKEMKSALDSKKQIIIIIQLHRFSLHQLNIDFINISYLHKFQQYFVEDLHQNSLEEISILLQSQNCWQMYQKLNLSAIFGNYCMDALKLIRFKCQFQEIEVLKEQYFAQCLQISNNQYFKRNIEMVIEEYLKKKKVDYSAIQKNHQDVMCCSNIFEALSKYVADMTKEVIFYSLRMVIEEGLLFYFDENRILKALEEDHKVFLAEPYLRQSERLVEFFRTNLEQNLKKLINKLPMLRRQVKFQRAIQSNIVRIRSQRTLIPSSFKDFSLLFKDRENKGTKNLEEIAMKIPFFRKNDNDADYQIEYLNTKSFIANEFKISANNFLKQIEESEDLQVLYLYDILTYYLKENNQSQKHIVFYIEAIVSKFSCYSLSEKLIILTNDKKLILSLFQLFSLLLDHFSPVKILRSISQIIKRDRGNPLVQVLLDLFRYGIQVINFNKENLERFKSATHYITYFRKLFIKMREISISYGEYGLNLAKQFLTNNKMLEMFEKISIQNEQLVERYTKIDDKRHSTQHCIYDLCRNLLEDQRIANQKEIVINFLSLDIFLSWLQKMQASKELRHERQSCIGQFVAMCNKYILFANNSAYFISIILPNLDTTTTIKGLIDYFNSSETHFVKQEYLDMQSNFTVAVSNYISSQIQNIFIEQIKLSVETEEAVYITKKYEQQFIVMLNNLEEELKIFQLFKIQFMKRYTFYYLQLLYKNEEVELQMRIDLLVCQENELMRYIRIYLLKHMYFNQKSIQNINRKYFEKNKCKWIFKMKDMLEQKEDQYFITPNALNNDDILYKIMEKFRELRFAEQKNFNDLVSEGLKSQNNKYQLLSYFMFNFYTRSISQNQINHIVNWFNARGDLKSSENILIRQLLSRYLQHKVADNYQYTNNEQFMKQLPLLNYLNIIVSTCNIKNPLNCMFFNQHGAIQQDYAGYLNRLFLIGSMKNPAKARLQFILERQGQGFSASSYINCSRNCDYINPVGGNFYGTYDGCAHLLNSSKCPFCDKVLGSSNSEAKILKPKDISQMLVTINSRKKITLRKINQNLQMNLLGYTLGNTRQQLVESLNMKKDYIGVSTDHLKSQSELVHHKILQTVISFVWYFLADAKFIKQDSLITLFKLDHRRSKIFLDEATNFYFEEANKSVKFANKNDHIIWHLGVGRELLSLLINYNEKQPIKEAVNNLTNPTVRDNFQKYIEDFIFPYCEKEKEKLILDSRKVKTVNKTDIVREIGDLKQHLLQYPQLKLYKLLKIDLSPSYENMKKEYNLTLAKDYPILSYLMNNETVEEKLKHFKTIYTFLSKLWKIFNLQITREESNKPLNQTLVNIFRDNDLQRRNIETEMSHFIKVWNKLAQLNYQLKHECHDFGTLQKIEKTFPLKHFLLDKDHMDNVQGRKLIGLIRVSANQYNSICGNIENSITSVYSQQSAKIFSSNLLNPTLISKDSKFLLFPTDILRDRIERYSSFSVEYGISNPSYPFDQIQSMIAKEFYGCKYLINEQDKFCYINYIGEQVHFITELRQDENQKTLQQTNMKDRIKTYLRNLEREETFYKIIKSIQGSLENIVIFFKNYKGYADMSTMTIRSFVSQKRIRGIVRQFLEEPIQSLPLSNLADFYETIEFLTFKNVIEMLDPVYKKPLERSEKEQFLNLLRAMKRQNRELGIPSYIDFKVAIYRLAGRNLLLMLCDEKKFISEQLCYVSFYWPKDVQIEYFQNEATLFNQVMRKLPISKVGDILSLLPFEEQMGDEVGVINANAVDIRNGRRIERVTENRVRVKRIKDKDDLH